LSPKFANKLGKTAISFAVVYSVSGNTVMVESLLDKNCELIELTKERGPEKIGLIEYEQRLAQYNAPSNEERLTSFKKKYELRLGEEFPKDKLSIGTESAIQAFLNQCDFDKRLALLKSQKQFDKDHPNGFRGQKGQ